MSTLDDFQCQCCCGACCRRAGIVGISETYIGGISKHLGVGEQYFLDKYTRLAPDRRSLILTEQSGSCIFMYKQNQCLEQTAESRYFDTVIPHFLDASQYWDASTQEPYLPASTRMPWCGKNGTAGQGTGRPHAHLLCRTLPSGTSAPGKPQTEGFRPSPTGFLRAFARSTRRAAPSRCVPEAKASGFSGGARRNRG